MKTNLFITWSKLVAVVILLIGAVMAFLLYKSDVKAAVDVLTTAMFLCAGLLGWRQAATTIKGVVTKPTDTKQQGDNL
jgi:hypothetical protein